MKKLSILLSIFLFSSLTANAYIDSNYTSTEKFLMNAGYSRDVAKIGNIVNSDPYRDGYEEKTTLKNKIKRIYWYLDPARHTDYDFYNHSIDLNNPSWKDL